MTPILTGAGCALATLPRPSTVSAAPAEKPRRVALVIRPTPKLSAKHWHGACRSANAIAFDGIAVDLDTEPRPARQQHMAGLQRERLLQELGAQLIVAHVVFEHQRMRRMVGVRRVGERGDQVAGGGAPDGAAPDMRRHPEV